MFRTRAKAKRPTRGAASNAAAPSFKRLRCSDAGGGGGGKRTKATEGIAVIRKASAGATATESRNAAAGPTSTSTKKHRSPSSAVAAVFASQSKCKGKGEKSEPIIVLTEKRRREMNEKMQRVRDAKLRKKQAAMAAAAEEEKASSLESFVGLRVRKFFPGYGWYCGTVDHVTPNPLAPWRIV